jgi:hypothetical protein
MPFLPSAGRASPFVSKANRRLGLRANAPSHFESLRLAKSPMSANDVKLSLGLV